MKFFIDTANLDQIKEARDLGILDGVTTNPSLMAKEGIVGEAQVLKHYKDICDIVGKGDVSAEVISTNYEEMIVEGKKLDFYTQELLREVNTIGSKSQVSGITESIVESKTLIERIREQVQNIE